MSRLIVITTEPAPLPGWPTTGAGQRAWALAEGLRSRGHEVLLLIPDDSVARFSAEGALRIPETAEGARVELYSRAELAADRRLRDCDAIVLQHWGAARHLPELTVPLAIDLAGPHLLERRLWGSKAPEADLEEKLAALRKADFVTCSGARQRDYFLAFLAMAGWRMDAADLVPVIPFSLRPADAPAPARGDRFIYGGFFLPWQDPSAALETALEEIDRSGRGELVFIGGAHPHADVSGGKFEALLARIEAHPRAQAYPPMSYDAFRALLAQGGVALDLMARNAERELAFPSRTVQYMALGVPVIHDAGSEVGALIAAAGAGWTLAPEDREGLRAVLRGLLAGEIDPAPRGRAALELVRSKLDSEKTIDPLDAFARAPKFREGRLGAELRAASRERLLRENEQKLAEAQSRLDQLLGKRWVRWGLAATGARGWTALPLAALAALLGAALVPIFWISDRLKEK